MTATAQRTRRMWRAGIGVLAAAVFGPGLCQLAALSWRRHRLDQRLAQLTAEQTRLTQEERRLKTDPTYVEGLIRSTFKLARPGEIVIPLDAAPSRGDRR